MEAFATLFQRVDQTASTNEKIRIMAEFFRKQDPETCAWTLIFSIRAETEAAGGFGETAAVVAGAGALSRLDDGGLLCRRGRYR